MFQLVEKMLETLVTSKPKTQDYNIYECEAKYFCTKKRVSKPRKLQRSPKIMGYYREEDDDEASNSEMFKEVILPCSVMPEDMGQLSCGGEHSKDSNNNKVNSNNVRVKVLLTKQEAAELLAKYASEANLGTMDVVNELAKLPAQRISVVSVSSFCPDAMALSTIPEEDEYEDEDEDEEQELLLKC